ncbi:hypothetical protein STENM223S_06029 [Streptomyces tendae]
MTTATGDGGQERPAQVARFSTASRWPDARRATRRAPTSHSTAITQNAAVMYRPCHFGADRQAQHQARRQTPGPEADPGVLGGLDASTGRAAAAASHRRRGGQPRRAPGPGRSRGQPTAAQHEEHQPAVQAAAVRLIDEMQPVHRRQRAREAASSCTWSGTGAADPRHIQHGQRADARRHGPPAERVCARTSASPRPDDVLPTGGCTTGSRVGRDRDVARPRPWASRLASLAPVDRRDPRGHDRPRAFA